MKWLPGGVRVCPKTGKVVGRRWPWWLAWLYPLAGLAALIWFVVRVGPKPSRAEYPCQRAAFPLASGFVVWLLGTIGCLAAFRWVKARLSPSRRLVALASFASMLVLAIWTIVGLPNPFAAAWTPAAHGPMGVGKGIYPGRVVWIRDAAATPYDGVTGRWWDDAGTNQAAVDHMLSLSLEWLTGASTDAAAWDALFRHYNNTHGRGDVGYQSGEKIAIKINCNNTASHTDADDNADASPHSVLALLRQLVNQAGVPENQITVYEAPKTAPSRVIPNRIYDKGHAEFPNVIWADCLGTDGRAAIAWTTNAVTYSVANGCGGDIPTCVTQATYLINMSLFKGHNTAGVTLTAKNHYGSINTREHSFIDCSATGMAKYNPLVDLIGHQDLGGKTILFMIDGLYGVRDVGDSVPTYGKWDTLFGGQWSASYFLSQDPVAIDSVGLDFLVAEFSRDATFNGNVPNADNYLHEAAQAGSPPSGVNYKPNGTTLASLGVHEHWNNPTDKQYTSIGLVPLGPGSAPPAPPGGGGGGHHGCGSIGLDLMAPLALLWFARRAGKRRRGI